MHLFHKVQVRSYQICCESTRKYLLQNEVLETTLWAVNEDSIIQEVSIEVEHKFTNVSGS